MLNEQEHYLEDEKVGVDLNLTYSRNNKYIRQNENVSHFDRVYRAMEVAIGEGAEPGLESDKANRAIVDFFDVIDAVWDERLALVMERKFR